MRPILVVLAALAFVSPPARAEIPQTQTQIALSLAPVARKAAPAVVNIYATRIVAERVSPFANDPFFSQFFDFGPAIPRVQNSLGSGVILRPDGIVVSNYHVVGGAEDIRVVLADRREFAGRVVLADEDSDLAIIRLEDAHDLPALELADSDQAQVGDLVLAIGNPFGVGQTVTSGIVSGLARAGGGMNGGRGYFIQTDAAINPGNSGGALVDIQGRLLGINTSILTRSGGSNGIGFAIPSNLVAQYVAQAEAGATRFVRPWAGIDVQPIDHALAEALGLARPMGVLVRQIHPQSPFAGAGIRPGDAILELDGRPVDAPQELDYRLSVLGPGRDAEVTYLRDGEQARARIHLSEAPDTRSQAMTFPPGSLLDGLTVAPLDPAAIQRLGLPQTTTGVVVTDVTGRARRTRLQPGDVLLSVNGNPVRSPEDLLAEAARDRPVWRFEFLRGRRRITLQVIDG